MAGEFELIRRYLAPLAESCPGAQGLRNDAAVLKPPAGRDLVLTADMLTSGVHFLGQDPPDLVARKLLRVNLSDLAAMGATPLGYLLTVAWPGPPDESWIAAFAEGLAADQAAFAFPLLGGDTTGTPGPLTLSVTALGSVAEGKALPRSTARAGDQVYLSGTLGDGALGLKVLSGELEGLGEPAACFLADRYRLPRPRLSLGQALADSALASAAIDLSDGLAADLGHVLEESSLAGEIEVSRLPLSEAAREALAAAPALIETVLAGGDDYELLFTAAPEEAEALAALGGEIGLALTPIGRLSEGRGLRILDSQGQELPLERPGWQHF